MIVLDGPTFLDFCRRRNVSHLVWIPDSALGTWEPAVSTAPDLSVVRPSREGEAIGIAAGLWLGGARPIVAIQSTGFFEAGDALRNVVHDLGVPLFLIVGSRGHFARRQGGQDSAARFAEPILAAWQIPNLVIDSTITAEELAAIHVQAESTRSAHILLVAE